MNKSVSSKESRFIKDPEQVRKVHSAYMSMRKNAKGVKVKVSYDAGIEFEDMGYVRVTGKRIVFDNPIIFLDEIKKANSFEFCAKNDGTIDMDFSYRFGFNPVSKTGLKSDKLQAHEETYGVFEMLVEEATEKFIPSWRLNNEKYAAFKATCDLFDKFLVSDIGTTGFVIDIDKNNTDIILTLLTDSYETEAVSEVFEKLIRNSKSIEFCVEEDCASMGFVFDGVWDKA